MQISRTQNQPNFRSHGAKIKFRNPDEIAQYMPQQGYLSLAKQAAVLKDMTPCDTGVLGIYFDIRSSLPVTLSFTKNNQPVINHPQACGIHIHTISEEAKKLFQLAKKDDAAPILLPKPDENALSRLYKRLLLGSMAKHQGVKVHNTDQMGKHLSLHAVSRIWLQTKAIEKMAHGVKSFELGFTPQRIASFNVACEAKSTSRAQRQNLMNIEIAPAAKALKSEVLAHDESPVLFPHRKLKPAEIEGNMRILETLENL